MGIPIVPLIAALRLCRGALAASPSVSISAGMVQGAVCSNTTAAVYFKSIPFAEPPVNALRFAPPTPYGDKFSGGTLDATQPPPSCIQFDALFGEPSPTSEDCLYLNVWAPANATKSSGLPVRVWLYGGGNAAGGISDPLYDGCAVAASGAIMVSINYRLGPLGFFALKEANYTGNQGIQDALLGLQWVQDNIAAFGGDTVLLHGESAGAIDSFTIATLEQAPKLFGAAIYESGGGLGISTLGAVQNISASFAQKLNCSTSDKTCLQSKSVQDVQTAQSSLVSTESVSTANTPAFAPCIDGTVIPADPVAQGVRVPSVFGTNTQEGTLFIFAAYLTTPNGPADATPAAYDQFLQQNYGDNAAAIKAQYPLSAFNSTLFPPIYAMAQVLTASAFLCPARRGLGGARKNNVPAWTYRFGLSPTCSWSPKIPEYGVSLLGATHSSEIPFVMGETSGLPAPNGTCEMTDAAKSVSAFMVNAWTMMAAQQRPGSDSDWPQWMNATQSLGINIGNSSQPGFVNYTECKLWDDINTAMTANTSSSGNATTTSPGGAAQTTSAGSKLSGNWATLLSLAVAVFIAL